MTPYYLSSGARATASKEFPSDKEAWETLRMCFSGHKVFMTLYKKIEIPINKPTHYVALYNSFYTNKIAQGSKSQARFVPLMTGCTSHKWGFRGNNINEA